MRKMEQPAAGLPERRLAEPRAAYRITDLGQVGSLREIDVTVVPRTKRAETALKKRGIRPCGYVVSETVRAASQAPPPAAAASAYDLGPRAKALLRGREINAEDLRSAGGAYALKEVTELLGITKQAISKRADDNSLLAVPGPMGRRYYPAAQFDRDGVVPGLKRVLEALPSKSAWFRLNFLVNPSAYLNGRRPLDVLPETGATETVVEAARRVGEQGA